MQKLKRMFVGAIILIASCHSMEQEKLSSSESDQNLDPPVQTDLSAASISKSLRSVEKRTSLANNKIRYKKHFQTLENTGQNEPLYKRKALNKIQEL